MKQFNSLKNKNPKTLTTCAYSGNIIYYVIIISVIVFLVFVFGLHKRLSSVKLQLDSCRSSCRSMSSD